MSVDEVLTRAESHPWEAAGTGRLLRAVVDEPEIESRYAWADHSSAEWSLLDRVWHQGSRYPDAAPLTRFIADLVADPDCPNRLLLLDLLSHLVAGFPGDMVIDLLAGTDGEPHGWSYAAGAAARDSLTTGVEALYWLLDHPDRRVRQQVGRLLVFAPARAEPSRRRLRAALAAEADRVTRAIGLLWLALLGQFLGDADADVDLIRAALTDQPSPEGGYLKLALFATGAVDVGSLRDVATAEPQPAADLVFTRFEGADMTASFIASNIIFKLERPS